MRTASGLLCLVLAASAGCNNASLAGGGKSVSGEKTAKKSGDSEKPLGTPADDPSANDGGNVGDDGKNAKNKGALGDGGDQSGSGNLGENDDLVSTCKNQPLKTSVKLLTPTIQNGQPGNKVIYELQLLDCKGKPRPISAQFIHFDLDAEVAEAVPNSYTVQVGTQTVQGALQVVEGVDLFGKSGPEYFHHKTDQPVTLTETALTATLTVDLKGQLFGEEEGNFSAQSYLRFGEAEPVAQTVTFVE